MHSGPGRACSGLFGQHRVYRVIAGLQAHNLGPEMYVGVQMKRN